MAPASYSLAELERLMAAETSMLSPEMRSKWNAVAIAPLRVVAPDAPLSGFLALAFLEGRILYFDEVEEEFGVAARDAEGQLSNLGTTGERLAWALARL